MSLVHLGLGSNLGDREANIRSALRALPNVLETSSLYETPPVGVAEQGYYYNAVCAVETDREPLDFLREIQSVERGLGRNREAEPARWGPRTIDIDILLWDGGTMLAEPELTIPHPRIAERAFVLVPLAEIAPDLTHPVEGRTIRQLLERLDRGEREAIRRISL